MTGAGGQAGRALRPLLPDATFAGHRELDVCDARAAAAAVRDVDVVVHLAAMTDVDGCERDRTAAFAVNAGGAATVAQAAAAAGARVIAVSTDYVFDGRRIGEWQEDDRPGPLSAYGASKLEGERAVLAASPENTVVRTSWVFGEGRNFIRSILTAARAGRALRVVADQHGRPTAADDLARSLSHLVREPAPGLLHVAGEGPACTWAELAEAALAAAGVDAPVERTTTPAYAASMAPRVVAPRPANSTLSLARARALGIPLGDWREAVRRYAPTCV